MRRLGIRATAGFRTPGVHQKPSKNHGFFKVLTSWTPKDTPKDTPTGSQGAQEVSRRSPRVPRRVSRDTREVPRRALGGPQGSAGGSPGALGRFPRVPTGSPGTPPRVPQVTSGTPRTLPRGPQVTSGTPKLYSFKETLQNLPTTCVRNCSSASLGLGRRGERSIDR